jgi:hypothetical protein
MGVSFLLVADFSPTFPVNVSVPSSKIKMYKKALYENVSDNPTYAVQQPRNPKICYVAMEA